MDEPIHFTQTIHCDFPDSAAIEKAYLDLPRRGRIEIVCRHDDLADTLTILMHTGFFGTRISFSQATDKIFTIITFKGKEGPCYDTGRTAHYSGGAVAVLDDDSHLLFGPASVCEKTASLYRSEVYNDFINVTDPDKTLLARLDSDPLPFSCDTFNEDSACLAGKLSTCPKPTGNDQVPLLYPGPFRLLILEDGSIIRRGQITLVSRDLAQKIQKTDNCILLPKEESNDTITQENFPQLYETAGPICLLETDAVSNTWKSNETSDFKALEWVPRSFRLRLKKVIEREDNYFLFTGSDPWDRFGCCPSEDVGYANRLVDAGILQSWCSSPDRDTCPSTIYAFMNEISSSSQKPSFQINRAFRHTVLHYCTQLEHKKTTLILNSLRWFLLFFVAGALIYSFMHRPVIQKKNSSPSEKAVITTDDGTWVYYFHYGLNCIECKNIDSYTRETLQKHFSQLLSGDSIHYRTININDTADAALIGHFDIIGNTIVFAKINDKRILKNRVVAGKIWLFSLSKKNFINLIRTEFTNFLQ